MEEKEDSLAVCPRCGYAEGTPPKESYHMKPGFVLHGKYIIGRVLGYGGFGITYIAWDYALGRKVAIKEFLPGDFATRMPGETVVTVYNGEATIQFEAGLERFMEEAQRLAKFNSTGSIVDIYDTFIENSTGYIVMQCLEGETVKDLMKKNGVMPYESARLIIIEVLKTLSEVHKEGIIHRDISPDNIFITNDNQVKLLDFGAARYASGFHSKSLSVILKPGYAPEEQYRSHGNQGPWSDVYATSATLYKMITGITIEESMERTVVDNVKSPLELGVDLPEGANTAIMNALNIHAELRTQTAEDFIRELESEQVERIIDKPKKSDAGKLPLWLKIAIPSVVAIAMALVTLVAVGVIEIPYFITSGLQANVEDRVPSVINQMMNDGQETLSKERLGMQIIGQDYDEYAQKDIIKTQSPAGGRMIAECYFDNATNKYMVYVVVSGGPSPRVVTRVVGLTLDEATATLQALGFVVETEEEYSQDIPAGVVISQDIADVEYAYGSTLHLVVSKGEMKVDASKTHKIPSLVGLSYDEAYKKLTAIGMYVVKTEETSTQPENRVLSQSVTADTECPEGTTVTLTVSNNTVIIPNVQYLSKDAARQQLVAAGVKVSIKEVESDTVAPGLVISQSKSGKATAGVTVTLTVSKGESSKGAEEASKNHEEQKENVPDVTVETVPPVTDTVGRYAEQKVTVPNVVGRKESDARYTLGQFGFTVKVGEREVKDASQNGVVVGSTPSAGQSADPGSTVTIFVGRLKKITVPDVVGKTYESGSSALINAGFSVYDEYKDVSDESLDGQILSTNPGGGQSADPGSTVTVVVGDYKAPKKKVQIPNVIGKHVEEATRQVANSGLKVRSVKTSDAPSQIVQSMDPPPYGWVEEGTTVILTLP